MRNINTVSDFRGKIQYSRLASYSKYLSLSQSEYAWDLFMRIMQVKRRSHKFLPHKFLLCHVTMHKTLECMNNKQKCIKFIKRAILTNSHKFVMHKKMSHHGIYAPKIMGHTWIKVCTHVLWVWFGGVAYLFRLSSPVPVDRTPL